MKFHKFFFFLLLIFSVFNKSFSETDVDARYFIIQHHYSGKILFEKEADGSIYPASMTKI